MTLAMRAFGYIASRPSLYRAMARAGRIAMRARAVDGWIAKLPGIAGGWTRSRDLAAPAKRTFQDRWRQRQGIDT